MTGPSRTQGVTLIELMVAVAVVAILAVVAAPALGDFILKARVRGAAEALWNDLTYARSESVLRNQTITVSITSGTSWCYGLNASGGCDCGTAGSCSIKTVSVSAFQGTTLASDFTALAFDGVQGVISGTGGTIGTDSVLLGNEIGQAGVKPLPVSLKLCSPAESANAVGYPSC